MHKGDGNGVCLHDLVCRLESFVLNRFAQHCNRRGRCFLSKISRLRAKPAPKMNYGLP